MAGIKPIPLALTDRQLEIVVHVANGLRNPDIAEREFLSQSTVEKTLNAARRNMGAVTLAHLVALTIAHGYLVWEDGEHKVNGQH